MLITVRGKVQGVGFRYSARSMAQQLKLTGFVKNTYNGSVFIDAEGDEPNIIEYIAVLAYGCIFQTVIGNQKLK